MNLETMRCLKNLPVWVVIRLCTNDNNMTQYWNGIDSEVELNMDVIDDPLGEAKEIHKYAFQLLFLLFPSNFFTALLSL